MSSIADGSVRIQISSEAQFATPSWLEEVALVACHLRQCSLLNKISERVRFARRRFGHYDVLDFLAVQIALRHQWRANLARFLHDGAAVCFGFHGFVRTRTFARGLNPQSFFSSIAL